MCDSLTDGAEHQLMKMSSYQGALASGHSSGDLGPRGHLTLPLTFGMTFSLVN